MVSMPTSTSAVHGEVLDDHPVGLVRAYVVEGAVQVSKHHGPVPVGPGRVELRERFARGRAAEECDPWEVWVWERPYVGVGDAGGEALAFPRVAEHPAQTVVLLRSKGVVHRCAVQVFVQRHGEAVEP